MKTNTLFVLLFAMLLSACGGVDEAQQKLQAQKEKQLQELEALRAKVMEVHDEVMPDMGNLMQLKDELAEAKTTVQDTVAATVNTLQTEIDPTVEELDQAYEGMMEWMRAFKHDLDPEQPFEEAKGYLESEMERVNKVKEDMISSQEKARELLTKLSDEAKSKVEGVLDGEEVEEAAAE